MSVYHQTLVVYGWEIGTDTYKDYDTESWENDLEQEYGWRDQSEGDVAVIYDGRGGRYCYFGVVVGATNSTRNGPQSFDSNISLNGGADAELLTQLTEAAEEVSLETDKTPEYHIFTHVT